MFAVYWTETEKQQCENAPETSDAYEVFETEVLAKEKYDALLKAEGIYCAGYGPIKGATEAHWAEPEVRNIEIPTKSVPVYILQWDDEGGWGIEAFNNKAERDARFAQFMEMEWESAAEHEDMPEKPETAQGIYDLFCEQAGYLNQYNLIELEIDVPDAPQKPVLDSRQLAIALAALRNYQAEEAPYSEEHMDGGEPATPEEIDAICEDLNFASTATEEQDEEPYTYSEGDRIQGIRRSPHGDYDTSDACAEYFVLYDSNDAHIAEWRTLEEAYAAVAQHRDHEGEPIVWENHYSCSHEDRDEDAEPSNWTDRYSCQVDEECPHCGAKGISPHQSQEIDALTGEYR